MKRCSQEFPVAKLKVSVLRGTRLHFAIDESLESVPANAHNNFIAQPFRV